jgi:glycolate oxidase
VNVSLPDSLLRASRSATDACKAELVRSLGDSKVHGDPVAREAASHDESEAESALPDAVVIAESQADIVTVLRIAQLHGVPVTPRAGGTGRSGGAIPAAGGIVLSVAKMNQLKHIDRANRLAVVEPGLITGELHRLVEAEGLFYPPDPNSWANCMIGGNVAENAGGPRAFKYGTTRDYVLGLDAYLMGGEVLRVGRKTVKGVTGYDVTSLLVGSEGTLAVFGDITVKLVQNTPELGTLLVLFSDAEAALKAVPVLLETGVVPRCIEFVDEEALVALRNGGASISQSAKGFLLIEIDGLHVESDLMRVGEAASALAGVTDVQVAQDAAQRARLWEARRAMSPATRKLAKHKIAEDVVVPRAAMPALLSGVRAIGERERVKHLTYGHAGDGNLHVNFLWNDDSELSAIKSAVSALMDLTLALGGTLSGEHGIGLTKSAYLPREQSQTLIDVQRDLKRVFDPKGLLNPGKIFQAGSHRAC